ncbi:lysoplasmalogenase family protein [Leucobacter soli]|uniref:lysoplasmalogenase family protein n=1 Tax=Leucobacter soli TaxID=2812850 RepID=UPI00361025BE
MRAKALTPFIPYIAVSVLHVVLLLMHHPLGGYQTKQLLMAALALAAVWATASIRPWPRPAMILLLAGLIASWIGDGAGLLFPGLPTLPMMILFFGIAHLAYIALFWRSPGIVAVRRVPRWALVYIGWWVVTLAIVGPTPADCWCRSPSTASCSAGRRRFRRVSGRWWRSAVRPS